MFRKNQTRKEKDIDLLKTFKNAVAAWGSTHETMYRSEVNSMLPHIRKILTATSANKYLTLNAPPMIGGQRVFTNVNVIDLIFDCPFDINVTPYVMDECDMAIGVLTDKSFVYPEDNRNEGMRKFDEDEVSLFESLITQGEGILGRYRSEQEVVLVSSKEFNDEYDQWRTDVFRLFETHFDFKNDVVFREIWENRLFIVKKRNAKYVEILLRTLKSCYRIPYKKATITKMKEETTPMSANEQQSINININNSNSQSQEQNQKQQQEQDLLVELLKECLTPYQLEELKKITQSGVPVSEKRKNLFEQILSFGNNVGANILADLLANLW